MTMLVLGTVDRTLRTIFLTSRVVKDIDLRPYCSDLLLPSLPSLVVTNTLYSGGGNVQGRFFLVSF